MTAHDGFELSDSLGILQPGAGAAGQQSFVFFAGRRRRRVCFSYGGYVKFREPGRLEGGGIFWRLAVGSWQ
jgi:hypothetical protein